MIVFKGRSCSEEYVFILRFSRLCKVTRCCLMMSHRSTSGILMKLSTILITQAFRLLKKHYSYMYIFTCGLLRKLPLENPPRACAYGIDINIKLPCGREEEIEKHCQEIYFSCSRVITQDSRPLRTDQSSIILQ